MWKDSLLSSANCPSAFIFFLGTCFYYKYTFIWKNSNPSVYKVNVSPLALSIAISKIILKNVCSVSFQTFLFAYDLVLPRWLSGKESAFQCRGPKRCMFNPWVRKIPWKRKWQLAPVFLPGKFHGQRSLVDYSPLGHKEWNMTEHECTYINKCIYMVGPPYTWVPHPWIQPALDWKYLGKRNSKKYQKAIWICWTGNYLHSIYIVFTTIYIAFTLC